MAKYADVPPCLHIVIASGAKQSTAPPADGWIASSLTLLAMTAGVWRGASRPHAGAAAVRTAGTGRNVIMIRNEPSPMIQEPM